MFYLNCTNFDDSVRYRRKTCCFDVKNNISFIQRLPFAIRNDFLLIIYQITFHTIDNLKLITMINGMVCIREGLHAAVVCNSNRLMPPLLGPFDNIFYVSNTVHITHLCMTVKLYSFYCTVVHTGCCKIRNLLHTIYRCYGQFTVKGIIYCNTLYLDKCTNLQICKKLWELFIVNKHFHLNRIGIVRKLKADNGLLISDFTLL